MTACTSRAISACFLAAFALHGFQGNAAQVAPPVAPVETNPVHGPALDQAKEAADAAIAACRADGSLISVVIMDENGVIKLVEVADGARANGWMIAQRKAVTSLTFKMDGVPLFDKSQTDSAFAAQLNADKKKYFVRPGARLIRMNGRTIGAVGISGSVSLAPQGPIGGVRDDACAEIALARLGARLE